MKRLLASFSVAAVAVLALPAAAQDRITATHAFPKNFVYSQSFLEFVRKANAAGKGVFEISVRGGPEAIPMMEQANAARNGVVDMVYGACSFYAATVPECDAVVASSIDGPTARKSGAYEAFNQAHQKRMGVQFLGWFDSGIQFHLWSTKEFKFDAKGDLDIRGFKVRGNPIYNAFLTNHLGAQVITLNSPEMYTALERGTVDISPWTSIGIMDPQWDKYLKYRLDPGFFSTDLGVIVNLQKWNALSPKTREILNRVSIEHEQASLKTLGELREKEFAELARRGVKAQAMPAEAGQRFVEAARKYNYQRMKDRLDKLPDGPAAYERFVKLFGPGA
jgi:TRAP-type transport system periplasmic protein